MDYTTIIIATLAAIGVVALAFLGGYERGLAHARHEARRPTVAELINELKPRRPKAAKNRRKATRKASSGGALW